MSSNADTDAKRNEDLARRLAATLKSDGTIDSSLYTPDCVTWHNTDQLEAPIEEASRRWKAIAAIVPDLAVHDFVVHAWAEGFGYQYTVTGSTPMGAAFAFPVAGFATVGHGRIARLEEYVDSAATATLRDAMTAAAERAPDGAVGDR